MANENTNNLTAADYIEAWNDSVNLLVNKALDSVSFDRTLEATIINQDKEDENRYLVETDDLRFYARSMDEARKYAANNKVYILVPDGDWEREKIIQGPILDITTKKLRSIMSNSLSNMAIVRTLSFGSTDANTTTLTQSNVNFKYNANYDYLGVEINLKDGNSSVYPFLLQLRVQFKKSLTWTEPITIFTFSDIIGSIENRSAIIPYSKLLPWFDGLSPLKELKSLQIEIVHDTENSLEPKEKITFDSIKLHFGYNKENILTNPLRVYGVNSSKIYSDNQQDTMYLEAYVSSTDKIYSTYNLPEDNLVAGLSGVYALTYTRGFASDIGIYEYLDPYWSLYPTLGRTPEETELEYQQRYEILHHTQTMSVKTMHNLKATTSRYKFIYFNEDRGVSYETTLTYDKEGLQSTGTTNPPAEELLLTLDDGDSGIYNLYGMDGKIQSSKESSQIRKIIATLKSGEKLTLENGIAKIDWIYPTFTPVLHDATAKTLNTPNKPRSGIIVANQIATEDDTSEKQLYKKGNYIIHQSTEDNINFYNSYIPMGYNQDTETWGDTFYYQLNNQVYESYTYNTVKCIATTIDGQTYTGAITFSFGGYGTMGTTYNLNLDIDGEKNYITVGDQTPLKLKATLERIDGEPLDVQPEFYWSWYEAPVINSDKTEYYSALEYYDLSSEDDKWLPTRTAIRNNENKITRVKINPAADGDNIYTHNTIYIKYNSQPADFTFNIEKPYYYEIAQVSVKYKIDTGNIVELKAYLPIPLCFIEDVDNIYSLQGPNRVVYDMTNNISYDKSAYQLLKNYEVYNTNIKWALCCDEYKSVYGQNTDENGIIKEYPQILLPTHNLKLDSSGKTNLVPMQNIMVNSIPNVASVIAYLPNSGIDHTDRLAEYEDSQILWIQPIVTLHNSWNFENVNNWTGKSVETGEDYILSPFIAAGTKNSISNSFTGVILGQADSWGLFGYEEGNPRFSFTEKGEAYIGNADKDYYFQMTEKGELELRLQTFYLNTAHLIIDSSEPVIKIYEDANNNDNSLRIKMGQLDNNKYGLNIYNGAITIYNKDGNETVYFDSDGNLNVKGFIDATGGQIGGFTISNYVDSSNPGGLYTPLYFEGKNWGAFRLSAGLNSTGSLFTIYGGSKEIMAIKPTTKTATWGPGFIVKQECLEWTLGSITETYAFTSTENALYYNCISFTLIDTMTEKMDHNTGSQVFEFYQYQGNLFVRREGQKVGQQLTKY